jgi:hypothetical protein
MAARSAPSRPMRNVPTRHVDSDHFPPPPTPSATTSTTTALPPSVTRRPRVRSGAVRCRRKCIGRQTLQSLDDGGVGHAAARTHPLQPVAAAALPERGHHRRHDPRAAGSKRVPDPDRATVDIRLSQLGPNIVCPGQRRSDGAKRSNARMDAAKTASLPELELELSDQSGQSMRYSSVISWSEQSGPRTMPLHRWIRQECKERPCAARHCFD